MTMFKESCILIKILFEKIIFSAIIYNMKFEDVKKLNIPKNSGCYQYFNSKWEIIYIGKAIDLRSRVYSYWQKSTQHTPAKRAMMKEIMEIKWIETDTEIEALLLEANLVKKHQPIYNIDLRDDKRFSYIKISTEDEIPGVFVTRKIDKSGKYFGPFTSAQTVREVVKIIRKIWPYCTEKKIKKKACFYAQINRCTGVCGGKYDIKEYKEKVIKPIVMFLSGEKGKIIKDLESKINELEKKMDKIDSEQADFMELESERRFLKAQLININNILAHTRVMSVSEKYAADVIELAKVLNLSKVPNRIEGYDISNIFGKEAVGSMVVFNEGEPNKSEYKKFKIKFTEESSGDVWMLKEVLERRFKHDDWQEPDLLIIDGGKAQLNVALRIMKKFDKDISVLAVSKGKGLRSAQAPDKIFFPGEKKPLELPLASPALHIIKRVRDESHRFAIKYHRELRKKSYFK